MIVVVVGGRNFGRVPSDLVDGVHRAICRAQLEREMLSSELDTLHAERGITKVIRPGQIGASYFAGRWAQERGVPEQVVSLDIKTHRRRASLICNSQMLEQRPDVVLAVQGGKGTDNMVRRARLAGIEVIDRRMNKRKGAACGRAVTSRNSTSVGSSTSRSSA